jgi:hypothetical protein
MASFPSTVIGVYMLFPKLVAGLGQIAEGAWFGLGLGLGYAVAHVVFAALGIHI